MGMQPADVSGYAVGNIESPRAGTYRLAFGFDDWARLWINGHKVVERDHDDGFAVQHISCRLEEGNNEIRVKLSNKNNNEWRLWAFCVTVKQAEQVEIHTE